MYYVISYDISVDQRRLKVAKLLAGYGQRVLESVFECDLEAGAYRQLRQKLSRLIRVEEGDSLRIYQLCGACRHNIEIIGSGPPLEESRDVYII
ncbi:CRISPR-associated endonuclease Cas2 [Chloroflexus sp.]|uniref:CRISPR-associated endonuclease Cas2 n=1 Tax=Chloroflexus sp. TaxID=1904827 RepID=UPI00298F21B1|nr:CRISPR-associated endonuclease Cas2 [Chloroflexus sp.]MCS6888743.1 CRISPR-associated endonuclease Cas2 [Chloroflexus sp.]MDW8404963.1 CRISPR-associated endonuclease Cas2 [Chloroflexus sp.]